MRNNTRESSWRALKSSRPRDSGSGAPQKPRLVMCRSLLFLSCLLAASVILVAQEPDEAAGEARDDVPYLLGKMCEASSAWFFNRMRSNYSIYKTWVDEARALPRSRGGFSRTLHYFFARPYDTPRNSICAPMNTTCCRNHTEKHIVRSTIREYGALFTDVVEENIRGCMTIGRNFYHAMYSNFVEVRRQLEIPIRNLLDDKFPQDLFDDFFSFLSSFSVTSDICDLPLQLNAIMSKIFNFIYDGQSGINLRETHTECYRNVSVHILSDTYERIFSRLERQVYNLDLIFRAMQMTEVVLESLKQHRISSVCTKPLIQLQSCAKCTGYHTFKPCLFYCMNVLRGCFADVSDISREFRLMTKALSDIPDDILGTFHPEVFIKESLTYFIQLTEALTRKDLKAEVFDTCSREGGNSRQKRLSLPNRQTPTAAAVATTSDSQGENPLAKAFGLELQCMEKVGDMLGNIPEQMCYQSKDHMTIADTGNHQCWLGSRMGTYYHGEVRFTKEDQESNPEFTTVPYLNQFQELCMEISTLTAEINDTLDLVLCLDDEDCTRAPFYLCGEDLLASGSGDFETTSSGRGSGSGSGRMMDDGLRDMENGDDNDASASGSGIHQVPDVSSDRPITGVEEPTEDSYTVFFDSHGKNTTNETSVTDNDNTTQATPTKPEVVDNNSDTNGEVPFVTAADVGNTVTGEIASAMQPEISLTLLVTLTLSLLLLM